MNHSWRSVTAGGMQRGRAAGPLAEMVLSDNTHLARGTRKLGWLTLDHFV